MLNIVSILGDDKVQITVLIEVEECYSQANGLQLIQTGLAGHILKAAQARVAKQLLLAYTRDEQIGIAVVIEIADAATQTQARSGQTRFDGHVGKSAVPVVSQQKVFHLAIDNHCAKKEEIQPIVAVVVKSNHYGAETIADSPPQIGCGAFPEICGSCPPRPGAQFHAQTVIFGK